ncbi:hypothetical protein LJC02_04570, partial [Breznakia sp. OttesenSCG-928-G09]|nr:hypothetical protein [Breznakia sp. OttesenSCG-928-G09]
RKMLADIDDGFTVKELNITKLLLGDYWVKQGIACLSVVIDYEVKDKDSEVKALQHTFRFKRRKEAKTSFFISKETRVNCKQCGAPIRKNTLSNCEYCGCVTYWLPFSWKLTSVESYTDVLYL